MSFVFARTVYPFAYPMHFISQALQRGGQLSDLLPQLLNLFAILLRLVGQEQNLLNGFIEVST